MSQLSGSIGRLKLLREELESPVGFYASHLDGWRRLAEATVRQVLNNVRPAGVDAEQWARQTELAAVRVSADLLGEDEAGVILSLGSSSLSDPFYESAGGGTLRLDQVERWVAAGRSGDSDGKRLDERDAGLSDEKIARNVFFAMKLGKPGTDRLRSVLLEFIGGEVAAQAERLYPEILKAWLDLFSVRASGDFRAFVHGRVKASGF